MIYQELIVYDQIDIFRLHKLIMPWHVPACQHWHLVVVDFLKRQIAIYDSIASTKRRNALFRVSSPISIVLFMQISISLIPQRLIAMLKFEHWARRQIVVDGKEWSLASSVCVFHSLIADMASYLGS